MIAFIVRGFFFLNVSNKGKQIGKCAEATSEELKQFMRENVTLLCSFRQTQI